MRLLNTSTFQVEEFFDSDIPEYAILSHTWGKDEVSFQDIQDLEKAWKKGGFHKIEQAISQALQDGFDYVWVDTCCIDKTSSAELSEAINSMYRWYQESSVCYAYLEDCAYFEHDGPQSHEFELAFNSSRWFTRGWTLQELLAPKHIKFYSQDWHFLGTKLGLVELIADRTEIDQCVLEGMDPLEVSAARKMSWAATRQTTRVEDMAYCLLGLFGVNIPLLYGEREKAFARLQEEILRSTGDCTIFLWKQIERWTDGSFLARAPSAFRSTGKQIPAFNASPGRAYKLDEGMRLPLLLIPIMINSEITSQEYHIGVVDCQWGADLHTRPAIILRPTDKPDIFRPWIFSDMLFEEVVRITRSHDGDCFNPCFDLASIKSSKHAKAEILSLKCEVRPVQMWEYRDVTIMSRDINTNYIRYHLTACTGVKILSVQPKSSWDKWTMKILALDSRMNDYARILLHGSIFIGYTTTSNVQEDDFAGVYAINFGTHRDPSEKGYKKTGFWYSCHRAPSMSENHWDSVRSTYNSAAQKITDTRTDARTDAGTDTKTVTCFRDMPIDSPFSVSMYLARFASRLEPVIEIEYCL